MFKIEPMRVYVATDEFGVSRDGRRWGEGVTHTVRGEGNGLRPNEYFSAYDHPLTIEMLNTIQGRYEKLTIWRAEGWLNGSTGEYPKLSCNKITTLEKITTTTLNLVTRAAIVVYCAVNILSFVKNKGLYEWIVGNFVDGKCSERVAGDAIKRVAFAIWEANNVEKAKVADAIRVREEIDGSPIEVVAAWAIDSMTRMGLVDLAIITERVYHGKIVSPIWLT